MVVFGIGADRQWSLLPDDSGGGAIVIIAWSFVALLALTAGVSLIRLVIGLTWRAWRHRAAGASFMFPLLHTRADAGAIARQAWPKPAQCGRSAREVAGRANPAIRINPTA